MAFIVSKDGNRIFFVKEKEIEKDIYDLEGQENLLDNDEITIDEEGFMNGYNKAL